MQRDSLLDVAGLKVQIRGHEIVKDVAFGLIRDQTLCLVGESGSGKTTTAMAVMGLLSKKQGFRVGGKVIFNGKNLVGISDRAWRQLRGLHFSMVFQDPATSFNPVFSIGEQISEMFQLHTELSLEEAEVKTIEVLEKVGLASLPDPFETYPHQLSGGMKQRAMIAMAISCEPQVLIADEPTSALDLTVQKEILALLKGYSGAKLLITHDFGVVAEMADVVAVMHSGEIVECGLVHEIFQKPSHPYTEGLLLARPSSHNRRKILPVVGKFQQGKEKIQLSSTHWYMHP